MYSAQLSLERYYVLIIMLFHHRNNQEIPLYARIYASKRFPDYFYDEKALLFEHNISLKTIAQNTFEYVNMASVCRQQIIDKKIISFLEHNHACNVIFLGAGLETAYFRIRNNSSNFYEVDLEHVIAVREKLLVHTLSFDTQVK